MKCVRFIMKLFYKSSFCDDDYDDDDDDNYPACH